MDSMGINIRSTDTILQPEPVLDQFTGMRTMLSPCQSTDTTLQPQQVTKSFLGQNQETIIHNHLQLCGVRGGGIRRERFSQRFRNEAVELLSNMQTRREECGHQPQQPQQQVLSRSSSSVSTFVPHIFQAASISCKEIHLNHPRDTDAHKPGQSQVATNGQQQQTKLQPTFLLVVDNKQAGPSRLLVFTLMPMKHFNPPSVASATGKESQHIIFRTLKLLQKSSVCYEVPTD